MTQHYINDCNIRNKLGSHKLDYRLCLPVKVALYRKHLYFLIPALISGDVFVQHRNLLSFRKYTGNPK